MLNLARANELASLCCQKIPVADKLGATRPKDLLHHLVSAHLLTGSECQRAVFNGLKFAGFHLKWVFIFIISPCFLLIADLDFSCPTRPPPTLWGVVVYCTVAG